jgi:hypothetical protein
VWEPPGWREAARTGSPMHPSEPPLLLRRAGSGRPAGGGGGARGEGRERGSGETAYYSATGGIGGGEILYIEGMERGF